MFASETRRIIWYARRELPARATQGQLVITGKRSVLLAPLSAPRA